MAQIIIVDLITLAQMKWELFYVSNHSWLDPIEYCPVYLALDSITSSAQIFFIIALNFHTISTYNLAYKTIAKNRIRSSIQQKPIDQITLPEVLESDSEFDDDDDDEFDDEADNICDKVITIETVPVAKNPDYQIARQRSIVIDYSNTKTKSQISVLWPIVFVWLLAISISIPLYFYGRIVPTISRNSNERMCGLIQIDRTSNILLQILLIKIRIVMPTLCLVLSTIYVIHKLTLVKRRTFDSMAMEMSTIIDENAIQILTLAFMIALTFIICSLQRMFGSLLFELISRPMMEYKYPHVHKWLGVAGCLLHYSAIIVRPFVYWRYENKLRRDLKTICCCISDRIQRRRKM